MMRSTKYWVLTALVLLGACKKPALEPEPVSGALVKGADISWVSEMESRGFKFYNAAGQERELTALMKETLTGAGTARPTSCRRRNAPAGWECGL